MAADHIRDIHDQVQALGNLYINYAKYLSDELAPLLEAHAKDLMNDLLQGNAGETLVDVIAIHLVGNVKQFAHICDELGHDVLQADTDMSTADGKIKFS